MSEDERQEMLRTVVEGVVFGLKRELEQLDLENPEQAPRREALPEVRRGGKVVEVDRIPRQKVPNDEP